MIEKLNCKKQAWEKEENMLPFGKDGGLHVFHDQVVRAIHIAPKERTDIELCMRVFGNTPHAVLLWTQYKSNL